MIALLFIALVSYGLKIFPFLSQKMQLASSGLMAKSIEYAVCLIMGSIIFNVAFGSATLAQLVSGINIQFVLALFTIAIAFFTCRGTGSILISLFVSMSVYIFARVITS
ncbi:hypothetical protein [Pseudomonas chlororaphis]|jgi:hypothetical protein|uniref:hypothetical protein n=1 Tax=Pseudomonas chlororaphis TaxID=587753 RepID=UPI0015DF31A3|nr:hypothetical protein [Pseudomonas chlororaphis]QLL12575.1 hypothetical protein H0I86_26885 [Pseudomonas chlororaphis subsp. aurantiaca]